MNHIESGLSFGLAFISAFRKKYRITEPMSHGQIAKCCRELAVEAGKSPTGCTKARVQQISDKALRKLRNRKLIERNELDYLCAIFSRMHGNYKRP